MKILLLFFLHLTTISMFAQLQPVASGSYHWNDLPVKKNNQREGRKIAEGTTPEFEFFEMHATVQEKGARPSAAHTQKDIEEFIIVMEGTMKCRIGNKTGIIGKGGILFIPPLESQEFENIGDGPLKYFVFMFRSKKPMDIERSKKAGGALIINADTLEFKKTQRGGARNYLNRPTAMCDNFEMHLTQLDKKGPSHAPHQHVDTEIILILEGNTTMTIDGVNYTAGAGDLYFMESGKMHGVSNAEENKPCSYFAFKWR